MLISIDSLIGLNLTGDLLPYIIFLYWLLCGIIIQTLFMLIDKRMPVGKFCHTLETSLIRRLFYFIAGGALLPMLLALIPPLFVVSFAGKALEEKTNRKKA